MRRIDETRAFRRDKKRERKGQLGGRIDELLKAALILLATDQPMPSNYRDHPLTGNWTDARDCHLRPDLVLIYRKPDAETLQLVRLGSHSELGI